MFNAESRGEEKRFTTESTEDTEKRGGGRGVKKVKQERKERKVGTEDGGGWKGRVRSRTLVVPGRR